MRYFPSRPFLAASALALAVLATSGCHWFRKTDEMYQKPVESRPLEVPPDLDRPATDASAAQADDQSQPVMRSSMAAPAAAQATAAAAASGFTIPGERDEVFAKVGDALAAIEGVTIATKAQLLGTYDVNYGGSDFLVRVTKVDAGAYVSAVDPRGVPAGNEAATGLIAKLKAALGG